MSPSLGQKISRVLRNYRVDAYLDLRSLFGKSITTFRLRSGEILAVGNYDLLGRDLLKGEQFEQFVRDAILSRVHPGDTVLDIGANVGYYTVQIATKVGANGRVVAFEPNPKMIEQLKVNISLNQLHNVEIEEVALSDSTGQASFCVPQSGKEAHGSLKPNSTFVVTSQIEVTTERLDEVLSRLRINKVDLIKMDVEGAERQAIRGASSLLSSQNRPTIIFECAEITCRAFGHTVYDVLHDLVRLGFSVTEIEYGMWMASPRADCGDALKEGGMNGH